MPQETLLPRELLEELSKREKTASSAGRNQGERKEKKVKEAAEERAKGVKVLVAQMNKNKKFQKEQLLKEGYTEFKEFFVR